MNLKQGTLMIFLMAACYHVGFWLGAYVYPNPNIWGIPVALAVLSGIAAFFALVLLIGEVTSE